MKLLHLGYLLVYIACGSTWSLLIKQSAQANGGRQPYEPIAVTFAVELLKLTISLSIVFLIQNRETSAWSKLSNLLNKWDTAKHFAVPAGLYCLFNGIAFYNLRLVSPPTYRLLINLKVPFSGLLMQTLIGTKLSKRQWCGLLLLVMACVVEQWDSFDPNTGALAIFLVAIQALSSSFAGVYFQLLLQRKAASEGPVAAIGSELGLWEKNAFMYCWTLFFNIIYLALFNRDVLFNPMVAVRTFDAQVLPIILIMGIGGVSTSLILRDMDVIVKEYANFAEMVLIIVGAWWVLGTELHFNLFVAVAMVSMSLYLYNVPHGSAPVADAKAAVEYSSVPTTSPGGGVEMNEMDEMAHNDGGDEELPTRSVSPKQPV